MEYQLSYLGHRINYSDSGQGKAVVFLHGFLESSIIWEEFRKEFYKKFRIICIDLPGHGKSAGYADEHSMESMAERVKVVLDKLHIYNSILIGHSMGGYVTLAFASLFPEYLSGFGLFHSTAHADTPKAKNNRDRAIKAIQSNHKDFIHQFIPDLFARHNVDRFEKEIADLKYQASQMDLKNIVAAIQGMKNRLGYTKFLQTTDLPVFFIIGKEDSRIPTELALEQANLPNRSEKLILDGVGHMGYIEAKLETKQFIRKFIEEIDY